MRKDQNNKEGVPNSHTRDSGASGKCWPPIIRLLSGLPFIGLLTPLPARVSVRSVLGVLEAGGGERCSSPNAMAFFSKSSLYCVSFYPLHCEGFRFLWR